MGWRNCTHERTQSFAKETISNQSLDTHSGNAHYRTSFKKRRYLYIKKTLNSNYAKTYLKQVSDSATKLNDEERSQLTSVLEYFKDLFDGTIGD